MSVADGMPSSPSPDKRSSLRWWQWIMMYPALLIAIAGAVPKFTEMATAIIRGLPPLTPRSDQEQLEAWKRNSTCDRAVDIIRPKAQTDYQIDLLPCPSGDILLKLTDLQNPRITVQTWIVTKKLFNQAASLFSTSAFAQVIQIQQNRPYTVRVIAIRTQGTTVVKRVQLSDNTCLDETIDGLTGRQLNAKQAPCAPF
jgi:hypothetical protein